MPLGLPAAGESDDDLVLRVSVAVLVFSRTLSDDAFHRWVAGLLADPESVKIWGLARWLGPDKVQANAIDEHRWQQCLLEATPHSLVAVLPAGTGGNLVDRLLANVREFVDPDVRVFVDGQEYTAGEPGYEVRQP
ncbi:MAG: hypothetical protein IRZ08_11050 [Frankia sp.]|nr:hypothetical protein [Frankia sp.]